MRLFVGVWCPFPFQLASCHGGSSFDPLGPGLKAPCTRCICQVPKYVAYKNCNCAFPSAGHESASLFGWSFLLLRHPSFPYLPPMTPLPTRPALHLLLNPGIRRRRMSAHPRRQRPSSSPSRRPRRRRRRAPTPCPRSPTCARYAALLITSKNEHPQPASSQTQLSQDRGTLPVSPRYLLS